MRFSRWIGIAVMSLLAGSVPAQKMSVTDGDDHVLMEVNDEGTVGSITLPDSSAAPGVTSNKLYNVDGALYWNGAALGAAGSVGGWTDGETGVYTTTFTDKVGVGTSSPEFRLSLENDGGILAKGIYRFGDTLHTSGSGTRMIWYPRKAAFRAGLVNEDQWDESNIGIGSVALGVDAKASGNTSIAIGSGVLASNSMSIALGYSTTANAYASMAAGEGSVASGGNSTAMGYYTSAESFVSMAIGRHNVGGGSVATWVGDDPLFEIGIGADGSSKTNAVTVLKNGKVGIGPAGPTSQLDVAGDIEIGSENAFYFGDPSTDGTWRIMRNGNNIVFQRRESDSWVSKSAISP